MFFNTFITKNGNHAVNTGYRYYFFSKNGKMLTETFSERYNYLSQVCSQGELEIDEKCVEFFETKHTTRNGVDLIERLNIRNIYELIQLKDGNIVLPLKISEHHYFIFDKVDGDVIKGFCWDHDSPEGEFNMHGTCILNKKELCSIYKNFKIQMKVETSKLR